MSSRFARAIPALMFVAAIGAGCSSSSNNSVAPTPVPGPNFSFAFPTAGTVIVPGTSNKQIFTDVGTWGYRCIAHAVSNNMVGAIIVDTSSTTADSALVQVGGGAGGFGFVPDTVTIRTGGYVRWINVSAMINHTATRP
jgi:plastocyanin